MVFIFERDDELEVVWDGGELLPDRATGKDNRWDQLEMHYRDLRGIQCSVLNTRDTNRIYNKKNRRYWETRKGVGAGEG